MKREMRIVDLIASFLSLYLLILNDVGCKLQPLSVVEPAVCSPSRRDIVARGEQLRVKIDFNTRISG
jgi:hypothetical protein